MKKNLTTNLLVRVSLIALLYTGFVTGTIQAQMRVGQPSGAPDGSAALDISGGPYPNGSQYRGIAPPKVALTQTSSATPIIKPAIGLLVYNTAQTSDLTPGYYYWEGNKWVRFSTATSAGAARLSPPGGGQSIPAYLISQVASLTNRPGIIYIADEGREGMFRYDSLSSVTPDGALSLSVSVGRYKRIFDGPINVKWFGAKGDEIADDTAPFQAAINAASTSNVKHVIVPWGHYNITNTITIKGGVTLQGQPKIPFKAAFNLDFALLFVKTTQGDTTKSVFILEAAAGIKGFTFYWPAQSKTSSSPIKYGWAITTTGNASGADNILVEDIMLTNCYRGINMDFGGQWNIRNIFGQTFDIGIKVDRMFDVSRIENIHFWDFWTTGTEAAKTYIQTHGRILVVGRADGLQGNNIFAWGHKNVLHFYKSTQTVAEQGGSVWGQFTNVLSDVCLVPIQIDNVNILQLTNINGTTTDKASGHSFIETGTNVEGEVQVVNADVYLPQTAINISSTNGLFKFTNITGRKQGGLFDVYQYKIINQSTAKVLIDEADYNEVSGNVQIGPMINWSSDANITSRVTNFSSPHLWTNNSGNVTAITNGSRFNLSGGVDVVRIQVPSTISDSAGVYIVECDLQLNNINNLGAGQFYLRLTDFNINDIILPGSAVEGHFVNKTHLRIPFIVRSSGLYFDFVYGGGGTCSMDITNLKLYKMASYKVTRSLVDWLQIKQPNSLNKPLPAILK